MTNKDCLGNPSPVAEGNPSPVAQCSASVTQTVAKLKALGLPALPVAPKQSADLHPKRYTSGKRKGEIERNADGTAKPLFTGKNPSYLDKAGIPHLVSSGNYQHRLPTSGDLLKWFANPANGVGTLGGWNGIVWIDLDLKQFATQEECDWAFAAIVAKLPSDTWTEQTHSGGYRIAVKCPNKEFTNFALELGGKHRGEALGSGRFAVLAPTIGASGNAYKKLSDASIATVGSLESIGVYPVSQPVKATTTPPVFKPLNEPLPGVISLERIISKPCQKILRGDHDGNPSNALTTLYKELVGWENWLRAKGIQYSGDALSLTYEAAAEMDRDEAKVDRIVKGIENAESLPPGLFLTNEAKGKGDDACLSYVKHQLGSPAEPNTAALDLADALRESAANKLHQQWIARKKFTADIRYLAKFVDAQQLIEYLKRDKYNIIALKSCMGSGKSEAIIKILKTWNAKVIALFSRNALAHQSNERWSKSGRKFYHLQTDGARGLLADPNLSVSLCIDSLTKFEDSDFDGALLILDEALSLMLHALMSSTVRNNGRPEIMAKLKQAVRRASKILLLDGNLNDRVVKWIADIRGEDASVIKIENTRPAPQLSIECLTATKAGEPDKRLKNDRSPIYRMILQILESHSNAALGVAKAIAVIADSRITLQVLDRLLTELGYKVLRLDRITVSTPEVREILKDPNKYILENQIDVLLMSPSVEMGFDINLQNYFAQGFALFTGLLSTDSQTQFLRRIRHCEKWALWCAESSLQSRQNWLSENDNNLRDTLLSYLKISAKETFGDSDLQNVVAKIKSQIDRNVDDLHFQAAVNELFWLNYERTNTKDCLLYELRNNTIKHVEQWQSKLLNKDVAETKEAIYQDEATAIFNSPVIDVQQAREIKKSFSASEADNHSADRALLLDRLPGIDETGLWQQSAVDFIAHYQFKQGRDDVRSLERLWLINNIDIAKKLSKADWLRICSTWNAHSSEPPNWGKLIDYRTFFGHDVRNEYLFVKTVHNLGFFELLNGEAYTVESPKIEEICQKVRRSKSNQIALDRSVGKDPIKFITAILEKFGCKCSSTQIGRGANRGKREYRFYLPTEVRAQKLKDPEKLQAAIEHEQSRVDRMAQIYECIDRKFAAKSETLQLPTPEQFEPDALRIDGIPPARLWLDPSEAQWLEQGWANAIAAHDETAKAFVLQSLLTYWDTQGSEYRRAGGQGWYAADYLKAQVVEGVAVVAANF